MWLSLAEIFVITLTSQPYKERIVARERHTTTIVNLRSICFYSLKGSDMSGTICRVVEYLKLSAALFDQLNLAFDQSHCKYFATIMDMH